MTPSQPSTLVKLDPDLAKPCAAITGPGADDYDEWLTWVVGDVLPAYAICAARHDAVVKAWPK